MKQFEYKVVERPSLTSKMLNEYGKNGWELVTINMPNHYIYSYVFKREIIPNMPQETETSI